MERRCRCCVLRRRTRSKRETTFPAAVVRITTTTTKKKKGRTRRGSCCNSGDRACSYGADREYLYMSTRKCTCLFPPPNSDLIYLVPRALFFADCSFDFSPTIDQWHVKDPDSSRSATLEIYRPAHQNNFALAARKRNLNGHQPVISPTYTTSIMRPILVSGHVGG